MCCIRASHSSRVVYNLPNCLLQGERETNELNNKLAEFSENAMKFTMDGGLSAYDYKNEEDELIDTSKLKQLAGESCVWTMHVKIVFKE